MRLLLSLVAGGLAIGCNRDRRDPPDLEVIMPPVSTNAVDPSTEVRKTPPAIEAFLIWGTDSATAPDGRYGPVQPDLTGQLKKLPLRRINYFLVNKARFQPPLTLGQNRAMGEGFQVEVRAVNGDEFEATVFRQREKPVRRRQSFSRGQVLVIGGEARAGSNCWLVLLRRAE